MEVTLTVMVQVELGRMVPLLSVTDVPPPTAVNVAVAPHPVKIGSTGLARKTFAGRPSVIDAWVRFVLGRLFRIVIDNRLVAPAHIVPGLKLLLTVGFTVPVTFSVALAGLVFVMFVPPPEALNAPTGILLIRLPAVKDVTLIDTVQDPAVDPT